MTRTFGVAEVKSSAEKIEQPMNIADEVKTELKIPEGTAVGVKRQPF